MFYVTVLDGRIWSIPFVLGDGFDHFYWYWSWLYAPDGSIYVFSFYNEAQVRSCLYG